MRVKKIKVSFSVWDVFLYWLSIVVLINLLLLPLKSFNPTISVVLSVLVVVLSILLVKLTYKLEITKGELGLGAIIIVFAALSLRIPPYKYVMGGQDQGTYVNIAHQYNKGRAIYYLDRYREQLTSRQKEKYDERGNYILPSIENWNRDGSEYSMVFYPAYPSILSVSEKVLGQDSMYYALTLLSIITLVNFYLIVKNLTRSKWAPFIALLLLSMNPVHVFFSKLPVGELAALAFITIGLYFLSKYLKGKTQDTFVIHNLGLSSLGFIVFSLTRMTFFTYIPVFIVVAVFSWKTLEERVHLSIYALLNLMVLIFSYFYYRLFLRPLFLKIYPRTIKALFEDYIPIDAPLNLKIFIAMFLIIVVLILNIKYDLKNKINKFIHPTFTGLVLLFLYRICIETRGDLKQILRVKDEVYDRWNLFGRGLGAIKHVPLFSIVNYVGIFLFILFFFLVIRALILKKLTKYHFLSFIGIYFLYIYIGKSGLMRYDYYNSRYYLTEVIPLILAITGIYLGELISKKGWYKRFALAFLLVTIIYFSIFSFFQIGKHEGNDMSFYKKVDSAASNRDLIIFINKNIYETKYPKNFNDYVAGPLKYYFDKKVLVIEDPEEINSDVVKSFFENHPKVYYVSNVPIEDYTFSKNEQKMVFNYNHFNNSPGCNYHNYEFLRIDNIKEIPLPENLKCKLLPNAYYERSRDYYFGEVIITVIDY